MPFRSRRLLFIAISVCFCVFCVFSPSSCGSRSVPTELPQATSGASEDVNASVILEPQAAPRWFELTTNGPTAISAPAAASLAPFEPWPLTLRIAGFLSQGNMIAAATNRDGFIAFVSREDGSIAFYRVSDPQLCGNYSVGSIFLYEGSPAELLYRDHFFVDPDASAANPRVVTLSKGNLEPVGANLPSLADFPPEDNWDVEAAIRGGDGRWYFRAVRAAASGGESVYVAASSLSSTPEVSSAAAFHAAQTPRSIDSAERPLRLALSAAADSLARGHFAVASAISPGQDCDESFLLTFQPVSNIASALASAGADIAPAWAFSDGTRGFVAFPNGALTVAVSPEGPILRSELPTLPENFTYTGVAALGNFIVASWEEQDGWAVGAAGFVVVDASPFVPSDRQTRGSAVGPTDAP